MNRLAIGCLATALSAAVGASNAHAQMRRSAPDDAGGPPRGEGTKGIPRLETTVVDDGMRWKQENSGGGFWMYAGRIVSRDSIAGRAVLAGWPQLPPGEKPPSGTFTLVRRPPGK